MLFKPQSLLLGSGSSNIGIFAQERKSPSESVIQWVPYLTKIIKQKARTSTPGLRCALSFHSSYFKLRVQLVGFVAMRLAAPLVEAFRKLRRVDSIPAPVGEMFSPIE